MILVAANGISGNRKSLIPVARFALWLVPRATGTEVSYSIMFRPTVWISPHPPAGMALPDVAGALKSFQQALDAGEIGLRAGTLDPKLYLHMDRPNGEMRLTYVRLQRKKVTAMVQFIRCDPVEGEPCFSVGWAVPEDLRGQGRAGEAFMAALREMRHGFAPHGLTAFWVEGIVGAENTASQRVAEKVISVPVSRDMDSHAGVPIVQYLRRIGPETEL